MPHETKKRVSTVKMLTRFSPQVVRRRTRFPISPTALDWTPPCVRFPRQTQYCGT